MCLGLVNFEAKLWISIPFIIFPQLSPESWPPRPPGLAPTPPPFDDLLENCSVSGHPNALGSKFGQNYREKISGWLDSCLILC